MALGKRATERQDDLGIVAADLPQGPGHPFYRRLNQLLAAHGFDAFVEGLCRKFYHDSLGRSASRRKCTSACSWSVTSRVSTRNAVRQPAERCADSRVLSQFLGYGPTAETPDHSSLAVIRNRLDLETHDEVFAGALKLLAKEGLLKGKTIGVDAIPPRRERPTRQCGQSRARTPAQATRNS